MVINDSNNSSSSCINSRKAVDITQDLELEGYKKGVFLGWPDDASAKDTS